MNRDCGERDRERERLIINVDFKLKCLDFCVSNLLFPAFQCISGLVAVMILIFRVLNVGP